MYSFIVLLIINKYFVDGSMNSCAKKEFPNNYPAHLMSNYWQSLPSKPSINLENICKDGKSCKGTTCYEYIDNCVDINVCSRHETRKTVRSCDAVDICVKRRNSSYSVSVKNKCSAKKYFNRFTHSCESKKICKYTLHYM